MCGPAGVGNSNLVLELAIKLDVLEGHGVVCQLLQLRHLAHFLDNERPLQKPILLLDHALHSLSNGERVDCINCNSRRIVSVHGDAWYCMETHGRDRNSGEHEEHRA